MNHILPERLRVRWLCNAHDRYLQRDMSLWADWDSEKDAVYDEPDLCTEIEAPSKRRRTSALTEAELRSAVWTILVTPDASAEEKVAGLFVQFTGSATPVAEDVPMGTVDGMPECPDVDVFEPIPAGTTHRHYVSTYCMHGVCEHCRLTCKVCGAPCQCQRPDCAHGAGPVDAQAHRQ